MSSPDVQIQIPEVRRELQQEVSQILPEREINQLAPEQQLTIVALRLAMLEKVASGLGILAFIWATVVLLGGFVSNIKTFDFWVVSVLLLTEGTRVFSRSHELEWQHAAGNKMFKSNTKLMSASSVVLEAINLYTPPAPVTKPSVNHGNKPAKFQGFSINRTWSWSKVPFLPHSRRFLAQHISQLLYILQLISATVTIAFSLARLVEQNYITDSASQVRTNLSFGLNIFYTLSLLEASIFLVERAYHEYNFKCKRLLERVADESTLGEELLDVVRQFFYEVYSKCLKGSVFDGLDLDLVTYSIEKLRSSSGKEQLGGALMLSKFVQQEDFLEDTLRKIGTTHGVTERLLEMITWRNSYERDIRKAASKVLCQLVVHNTNSFRVMGTTGALESVITLLTENDDTELKLHGLRILKSLAKDDKNCVQIGNTRGLIEILVSNIELHGAVTKKSVNTRAHLKALKKSLQLLARLVSTTGEQGKSLRCSIVKNVYTLRNLRDALERGGSRPVFRELVLDIVTSLALDESIKERIGSTGGIVQSLIILFAKKVPDEKSVEFRVRLKAGEALHLLVMNCPRNSSRIPTDGLQKFCGMVKDTNRKISACAAYILRSMFKYRSIDEQQQIVMVSTWIIEKLPSVHGKQLESFLGLLVSTMSFLDEPKLSSSGSHNQELVRSVTKAMHIAPSLYLPRIRRHAVELAVRLMRRDHYFFTQFKAQGIENQLQHMLTTVSDVENFVTFSGMMGITRHSQPMEDLLREGIQVARHSRFNLEVDIST